MPTFRYETGGTWYKGNTHIHSTASDGAKTFPELAQMYAGVGYDFLFRTDHWVASDVEADGGDYPLLWLDGVELDGNDYGGSFYHVVCLGRFTGIAREMGLVTAMEATRAQGGVLILAHPHWSENSLEDALRWGFHGVEIFNYACHVIHGKGSGAVHWSAMLQRLPGTLAFAADDAHASPRYPNWNGAWVMVNAPICSREAIMGAIRVGNFYSTRGPEFRSIEHDGTSVVVRTSPVQFARLVGPAYWAKRIWSTDGRPLDEAAFEIPPDWPYAYVELEDSQGRRAWTNPLFADS